MIRMILAASIVNPKLDKPITHAKVILGRSKTEIFKQLKLSGEHICKLKSSGKTTWTDTHGSIHTLILKEAPIEVPEIEATTSIFRKVKDFLCVQLSQLKLLFQRLSPNKVPKMSLMQAKPLQRLKLLQNRQ